MSGSKARDTGVALHAASQSDVALCQAVALPDGEPPAFIQLLPAGTITTVDGRGPYTLVDAAAVARHSIEAGERLPIDENHSSDLAAPQGRPSPARGWIVALEARQDGIWGKVEWTEAGRQLVADKAYRHISPAIKHTSDGRISQILRASLTNRPNLRGLAALHQETDMDLLAKLREALGLGADADADKAIATIKELKTSVSTHAVALQAQLSLIAEAMGLKKDADATAVLGAVKTLKDGNKDAGAVTALQAELVTVSGELKNLRDDRAREKAEAAVDGAIKAGKPGVKALRDHYVSRHMADAAAVEKELAGLPSLTDPSGAREVPPAKDKDGKIALNAEQSAAAKLLGIKAEDYAKTLAAEAAHEEAL